MRHGRLIVSIVACICLVSLLYSMIHTSVEDYVPHRANELRTQIMPPGASVTDSSPIRRTQFSAEVTWELMTRQTWTDFVSWTREKLSPDFHLHLNSDESAIIATRTLQGDAENIIFTKVSEGLPLRVRVTFQTSAD